jgi:DNA gyrase/topoisomerase IV subunit B
MWYICRGDSAGWNQKQGRSIFAILPQRGKILNVESDATIKPLKRGDKKYFTALGVTVVQKKIVRR